MQVNQTVLETLNRGLQRDLHDQLEELIVKQQVELLVTNLRPVIKEALKTLTLKHLDTVSRLDEFINEMRVVFYLTDDMKAMLTSGDGEVIKEAHSG